MSPAGGTSKKPRFGFRSGLERDVYHILDKLEAISDHKPFTTVPAVYDAIKRSNSSLSRQKKRPLEDAIDRVLQMRKQEQDGGSDDSEAAMDKPEPTKTGSEGFLLNRQMTKLWNTESGTRSSSEQPLSKKRRFHTQADGQDNRRSISESEAAVNGAAASTSVQEDKPQTKKSPKTSRFKVEEPGQPEPLAGMDQVYRKLLRHTWLLLRGSALYESRNLRQIGGILLSGPSGTGKKTLVRNLAATLGVPLLSLAGCFQDPERTEKSLSEAVDTAMSLAPSIIFIEQIDRYMARPGSSNHSEHQFRAVCRFADQMTRIRSSPGRQGHVLAFATTSRVADVDLAILKFGLLEKTVQLRIPDCAARRDILRALTNKMKLADDVDLVELAKMTYGYVGSDLAAITLLAGDRLVARVASADDADEAMLDLHTRQQGRGWSDAPGCERDFFARTINDPQTPAAVTMEDLKTAIKGFTPSLRKEGFSVSPSVTWDQVGALEEARKQLQTSIIGPIKEPELYRNFGLTRPAGVLLYGPPGCGKTLVAQAVANEAEASFILVNGPELLNKYVGESERAVRELFQRARSSTPCIIFFDEIDSMVPRRSNVSNESGARVVNALLTEFDGARDRTGIYVMGTTNRIEMLDEAMLRPGRLSVQLLIDLPTPAERVDILRAIYRTCHKDAADEALAGLAGVALDARCTNFSGADLSGLHTKAAEHALERWRAGQNGGRVIAEADWEHALAHTRASVKDPAAYRLRGGGGGGGGGVT